MKITQGIKIKVPTFNAANIAVFKKAGKTKKVR